MSTLSTDLRNKLERTCVAARGAAEQAAQAALESMAVQQPEAFAHMIRDERDLRNKLRARARQLSDVQDAKGYLAINHLVQECAYEHWHRMLFARFLAENGLLIPPELGTPITLAECKELAEEEKTNLWALAGRYAQTMLPEIFRADDPVLQVPLAREDQLKLEHLLDELTTEVFTASDSLGWSYQFWQTQRKKEVNESEVKIGADEISPVTQLFTEDYMVDFLLDNTLGSWWWGRCAAVQGSGFRVQACQTEEECRRAVALPGCEWKYLRFVEDDKKGWQPAAGTFDGWPKTTKELKCLDPCMGSGHFVVAMFERLVALRMAEERLNERDAVAAVIRDNLFGLEIDPRCTQIAAFNLALTAWRRVGHCTLPAMHLACSGLAPNAREADWLTLAGDNEKLQRGMARLYRLFQNAPVLGSLINPRSGEDDLLVAGFHELQPLLEQALALEVKDDTAHEMAVVAQGIAKAAEILAGQFSLVATNVPFLGIRKQCEQLKEYVTTYFSDAKECLSTVFCARISNWLIGTTMAVVTPQNWFYQFRYRNHRRSVLKKESIHLIARLGEGGFDSSQAAGAFVALSIITSSKPNNFMVSRVVDAAELKRPEAKAAMLRAGDIKGVAQESQLSNPDARLSLERPNGGRLLNEFVVTAQGIKTGDDNLWVRCFWEVSPLGRQWRTYQTSSETNKPYAARSWIINWVTKGEGMIRPRTESPVIGKVGVVASSMREISVTIYSGDLHYSAATPLVPLNPEHLPAIWAFCSSSKYNEAVREIEQNIAVTTDTLAKVPFDLAHWQKVAAEKYPHGLPKPFSSDPTQWLFNGHPKGSDNPLHVAVARLLGYQWPRQTGSSFPECPALEADGLEALADEDGIVCVPSVRGEDAAAERLRKLLVVAYGDEWTPAKEIELIRATGSKADDLDEWLRNDFFEQHCALFHQRPFLWHIWDGRKRDGFHAIVNYHKMAEKSEVRSQRSDDGGKKPEEGNHRGRKVLESLTHSYLGDWISRQKDGERRGEDGAEARLAAALALKERLEAILEGEPPFDLFVRWKPLAEQAVGWEPDINDGVRMNIRPFLASDLPGGKKGAGILRVMPKVKWDKDRGKEPHRDKKEFPWFWTSDTFTGDRVNDVHLTTEAKLTARK